jgi:DNA-binding beta-propeller fold protein YncE
LNEVKSCVHVFDTHKLKALGVWSLAPGEGGTGLAVDSAHHRLFATCGNNKLVVLDTDSGKVVATPAIGEDADGVVFDSSSQQIFTSNADSTVTVILEDSPTQFTVTQTVATAEGSKTLGFDNKTGDIFLATAKFGPKPEPTKEVPEPRAPVIPGSLEVIVLGK